MLMPEKERSSTYVDEENSVELSLFAGLSFPQVPTHTLQRKLQTSTVSIDPLSSIKEESISLSSQHIQPDIHEEDEEVAETSNLLQQVKEKQKRTDTSLSTLYATEVKSYSS
jgi:hypothetical protein